jgi:hypothetical protein
MKHHVLTAVIEGSDEPAYYNKNIGGIRFYVPLEKYEDPEWLQKRSEASLRIWANPEHRKKISESAKRSWANPEFKKKWIKSRSKGPYRITFDTGKEIIVDNLNGWAKENNYNNPMLFDMLNNRERQRFKGNTKTYPRKRHKDIVKVERLSDEEEK